METTFWKRFKTLCESRGTSPNAVLKELGASSASITYWSRGGSPRNSTIKKSAEWFKIPDIYFFELEVPEDVYREVTGRKKAKEAQPKNSYSIDNIVSMPVVGSVRAGYGTSPMLDYEDEYISIPTDQMRGYKASECRLIRVRGDSMYPKILDGDLVLIHVQPEVESDETAVVFNGGEEATIKKIRIFPDHIEMIPANNQYETKIVAGNDLKECRIYGKVLSLIRSF